MSKTRVTGGLERTETKCYLLAGILYVPHYKRAGVFVQPGHQEFDKLLANAHLKNRDRSRTEEELKAAGALAVREFLWPRLGAQKTLAA